MKKKLLNFMTGSFVLAYSASMAQPSLTGSAINPTIGESFTYTTCTNYFNQGPSGASQTWNFSTSTGTTSGVSSGVSVSSTPNGSSFPNANIAFYNAGGSNYSYQKTTSTAYQNYGNVSSSGVVMSFSNPEDFLRFPFTYNNTYNDPWSCTFINSGYTFYRTGTTSITADGYGTLITPAGTFNNALRIHMVQTYQDSAYIGMPYVIPYTNDEYMWYVNGTHAAIAATFTFDAGGSTGQSSFYLGAPTGIDNLSAILTSLEVFPNPASDLINIKYNLTENKKVELCLFNTLGEKIQDSKSEDGIQGSNTTELNIAEQPEGIYFAQIILDGNVAATKRFVVIK
ncbi:MAG: hypothetical protein A3F72_08955 [Bacteroidetes bacterium RIFCSPLOWO2_12_FULL_35_15]|nr:MAG: hypothetical protein A3F72_08955 [Bacteroidetes bacterium RIFCSPLOWO2_12_FULL_35_15]